MYSLLQDKSQLLFKQNGEAERRQSIKSAVVVKAKVMSDEDMKWHERKCAVTEAAADDDADKWDRWPEAQYSCSTEG